MKNRIKEIVAFTLVEILIATGILAGIVALILWLTTTMLGTWERSTGKISANGDARIAMDLLTSDLSTLILRNDEFQWMNFAPVPGGTSELGELVDSKRAYRLLFFSTPLDQPKETPTGDPALGDVCAIQYRLAYKNPFNNSDPDSRKVYGLYRTIADSKSTFDSALGQTDLGSVWTNSFYDSKGEGKHYEEFLIGNVVEFFVQVVYEDSTGTSVVTKQTGENEDFIYGPNGGAAGKTPKSIIISLVVLSENGMKQLEANSELGNAERENLIRQNSERFTTRVRILSTPL